MDGKQLKQFIKLSESRLLDRYLKSRGISPENLTSIQKISHSKSSPFLNWVKLNGARQDVFKEELEQEMNEVLSKDASAGDWIHDFIHSDNPKFAGKSKEKRQKMALAAYYAKQKNEEVEELDELNKDTLYSYAKKSEKDQGDQFDKIGKGIRDKDPKSANAASHKFTRRSIGQNKAEKRLSSESLEIPELQLSELTTNLLARYKTGAAASAKAADAAGNYKKGDKRFKGMLKATTKQFDNDLKKHNQYIKPVKEEIYDSEKEDKSVTTYGKKPKFKTVDPKDSFGSNKPQAAAILTGGKTLTGAVRDTIEIDPVMRRKVQSGSEKINKK
jgi:hypothetical protein